MEYRPSPYANVNLDVKRFVEMRFDAEKPDSEILSLKRENYMADIGNWLNRWRHWDNRGPGEHPAVGECNIPYFRYFEEVDYKHCVTS